MKVLRVVTYVRMSSDKQEDSLDRQRAGINAYAQAKGYTLKKEYLDAGISGWAEDRPGFKQMMADAVAGKFDLILVDEDSRLSRQSPLEFMAKVAYPLQEAGVRVESTASGPLDWESLGGQILTVVKVDKAREEVRNLSRRVLGGMVREAKAGMWNSPAPFGYIVVRELDPNDSRKIVSRKLVHGNPVHVEAVRWMFNAYASGRSLGTIATELERRGILSKTRESKKEDAASQPFTPQGIAAILKNPVYVGDHVWNRVNVGKFSKVVAGVAELQPKIKRGKTQKEDWIVVEGTHPAIIDRELFQRVQDRSKGNRRRTTPLPDGGGFKFSRLLVCEKCGAWMSGFTSNRDGKKKYRCGNYYQHGRKACDSNTVNESTIVRVLGAKLQEFFLNPAVLDAYRETVRELEATQQDPDTRKELERRLKTLDTEIKQGEDRLVRLPEDMLEPVMNGIRRARAERNSVVVELAKIESQTKPTKDFEKAVAEITANFLRLTELLEHGAPADVRAAVDSLIDRVIVTFRRKEVGKIVRTHVCGGIICIRPPAGVSNSSTGDGNT